MANPLGIEIAAIIVLGLAIEDLWVFANGGRSAFEHLLKKFGASPETIEKVRDAIIALVDAIKSLFSPIETLGKLFDKVINPVNEYMRGKLTAEARELVDINGDPADFTKQYLIQHKNVQCAASGVGDGIGSGGIYVVYRHGFYQ